MLTKDIYGKTLSSSFDSAIESNAQKVKPKITIDLLDSRHLSNVWIESSESSRNNSKGKMGYYFSAPQSYNGHSRQTFTWAVSDALDKYGNIIRADGTWYTMPSGINSIEDDYEFGWWTSNLSDALGDFFDSKPYLRMTFDERKINKITITTSEYNGQVETFQIRVMNVNYGDLLNTTVSFGPGEYKKDIYIKSNTATQAAYMANQIELILISTKNPYDVGRIHEINPIYEVDVTDQIINYGVSRTRDVHDSSLPIAGTQTNTLNITLDNTSKDWNIFNNSSAYGKYMVKDLKVNVSLGWRIKKTDDILSNTVLYSDINDSNTTMYVDNTSIFPSGGAGNNFIAVIDPDNESREIILCNSVLNNSTISIASRGYAGTTATTHSSGSVVQFDPYEYIPMGTFYVDEWKSSTSSMTVDIAASDWSKTLNESTITKGYMLENSTIGDAVKNLLLRRNFPQGDYSQVRRYVDDAVDKKAICLYSFGDTAIDRNENDIILSRGLRIRFWAMRSGNESNVKTFSGEVTRPLSVTEAALGFSQYTTPDKIALSQDISGFRQDGNSYTSGSYIENSVGYILTSDNYNYASGPALSGTKNSVVVSMRMDIKNVDWLKVAMSRRYNMGWWVSYVGISPYVRWRNGANQNVESYIGSKLSATAGMRWYRFSIATSGSNTVATIEVASDSASEPTSWTTHASITRTGMTGIKLDGSYELMIGSWWYEQTLVGTISRYIERHDGAVVVDADFAVQATETKSFTESSANAYTITINTTRSLLNNESKSVALNLSQYSFTRNDGIPCSTYFNGIVDGYYIPTSDGNYNFNVYVKNGGAKIYLDDQLVGENWKNNTSRTKVTTKGYSPSGYGADSYIKLTAGRPYKIKIYFFHNNLPNSFDIQLYSEKQNGKEELIRTRDCVTTVVKNYGRVKTNDIQVGGEVATTFSGADPYYSDDAVYVGNVILNQSSGISSDPTSRSVYLQNNGYIRIPYNYFTTVSNNVEYTYEVVAKFNNGSFSGDGEYISSFANSSPTSGFEFFYNGSSSHGFKIITSSGVQTVSSNTQLSTTDSSFITATIGSGKLSYYVNGELSNSITLSGNVIYAEYDTTVGGRGAFYNTQSQSEQAPSTIRSFYIDQYGTYKRCLSASEIKDRYISAKCQELTIFPFLFGNDLTYRAAIDEITLAELGRFYIDEEDKARYEHYYRFFEPTIDQHANVQYSISDTSSIISSELSVQLQANKVTVNLSKLNTATQPLQPLWKPDSNTFLRIVSLSGAIDETQTSLYVGSTTQLAFPETGFFIIDNEIIKYAGKTENTFTGLTRGYFDTTPSSHIDGSLVREVRYYQAKFDKAPAFNVKHPLITGIFRIEPDQIQVLKFEPSPYSAEVIIAATTNMPANSYAIVEGTDIQGLPWGMSIAGCAVVISSNDSSVSNDTSLDVSAEIVANIKKYGLKEVKIENTFISDRKYAEKIINFIVSKMKDPVPVINVESMALPKIQLGDRIRITAFDSFDIINGDFWVVSHNFSYGSSIGQSFTLRKVV